MTNTSRQMGVLGSLVLVLGVFAPLVSGPVVGNINYFQNGQGDGVIVLLLGLVGLLCAVAGLWWGLGAAGGGSAIMVVRAYFNVSEAFTELQLERDRMEADLAGNPFAGLADALVGSVSLEWGWGALIGGALLMAAAAVMPKGSKP